MWPGQISPDSSCLFSSLPFLSKPKQLRIWQLHVMKRRGTLRNVSCHILHGTAHCHLMAVINYSSSFQNSLMAASAAAAYCFQVYYCHENHLFHPAKGAPQKRDDLPRKKGTLLVPFLRCPPSILMGNGGGTPPPPSLFTGAQSFIAYTMSPSLQRRMIRHFISAGKPVPYGGSKKVNCVLTWRKIMWWEAQLKDAD